MATDIAFSLGVLSLLGRRVPFALKVFLTAFAIVDDLGAIGVIVVAYSGHLAVVPLVLAGALVGVMAFMGKRKVQGLTYYLVPGALLWFCILKSGIHASIAGVLVAALIPLGAPEDTDRPLDILENALHPWVAYGVMPLFALANAGVALGGAHLGNPLPLGTMVGLAVGKPVGIVAASWLAVRGRVSVLPQGMTWGHVLGVGCLGGIGFTMSIFVAQLAFSGDQLNTAKLAIVLGSSISAIAGAGLLLLQPQRELVGEDEA